MDYIFYGNTVQQWLIAFSFVILSLIVGRIAYWFSTKILKKLATRTQTPIDNILIDMLEEPLVFAGILFGIWESLKILTLSKHMHELIKTSYYFLIIFTTAWLVVRMIDVFSKEYLQPIVEKTEQTLDDTMLPMLQKISKILVWIIAIIISIDNSGYDVGALLAGLGIGGFAFALAAQDTISNLFGGIALLADHPFTVGDWIRIDGQVGQIKEIGLRSTQLQTVFETRLIIPNAKLMNTKVENLTSAPARRIELLIPMAYNSTASQIELAIKILDKIVMENERTLDDTSILFRDMSNYAINIRFRYFVIKGKSATKTRTSINLAIMKEFEAHGLKLAMPMPQFLKADESNTQDW
jgi:MscS family membrane protein